MRPLIGFTQLSAYFQGMLDRHQKIENRFLSRGARRILRLIPEPFRTELQSQHLDVFTSIVSQGRSILILTNRETAKVRSQKRQLLLQLQRSLRPHGFTVSFKRNCRRRKDEFTGKRMTLRSRWIMITLPRRGGLPQES